MDVDAEVKSVCSFFDQAETATGSGTTGTVTVLSGRQCVAECRSHKGKQ